MSAITERIDGVLAERGVSKAKFYADCKITSSAYSQWNTGKTEPRPKKLKEVAEYLNVNYTWLIDGKGPKEKAPTLTNKDERDIEKRMADILKDLENQDGLMYSGEPMDDADRELLATSIRNSMEIGKKLAKQKYTPKKYRKE